MPEDKIKIPNREITGIQQDVGIVAEEVSVVLDDSVILAETLAEAMIEIENLKSEISTLKGE